MFKTKKTSDASVTEASKTLLCSHHGWGKTTQCKYYEKKFGKGFILSGESGLISVGDCDIDYLPFTSWDGAHDPERDMYSFRGIVRMMSTKEFRDQGYKWVCLDSLTELSDRLLDFLEEKHKDNKNGYEKWGEYARLLIGALKWIRDLPFHVLVTSLAGEETNDNGVLEYWPMVKGNKVGKQIPGLFDHVFCGARTTEGDNPANPTIIRHIITDEVRGWHGKCRDPRRRLLPVELCSDITALFDRMEMTDEQFAQFTQQSQKA